MRELLRATTLMTVARIASLLFAIVGAKVVALTLEPAGVGVMSQASSYSGLATNLLTLGLGVGVTRYIAVYRAQGDTDRLKRLMVTVAGLSLLASAVIALILVLLAPSITTLAFGHGAPHAQLMVIVTLSVPFSVMATLILNMLQGFKQVAALARITVIAALWHLLLVLALVPPYRLSGGIYALAFAAVGNLLVNGWFLLRLFAKEFGTRPAAIAANVRALPRWVDLLALAPLVSYGISSLVVGGAGSFIDFFTRARIFQAFGEASGGYYQSAFAISNGYLPLILGAMSTYAFPRFSELHDTQQIRAEIATTFRFALLIVVPILVLLMVLAGVLIPLLWSVKFRPSVEILRGQLLADFFMVTAWAFGIVLLPIKRVRFWLINSLMTQAVMLIGLLVLLPRIGIMGAVYNFLIAWILNTVIVVVYLRRTLNFTLSPENTALLVGSLAVVVFTYVVTILPVPSAPLSVVALALWLLRFVRREELGHARWLMRSFLSPRA